MALETLERLNPGSTENYISLTSVSANAALNYDTTGMDLLLIDLTLASGVIGTVVVSLFVSLNGGASYSPTALATYTTAGLQVMARITGANRIRLQTTTADAGAGTICPVVRAGVDVNV